MQDERTLEAIELAEGSPLRVVLSEWLRLQGEAYQAEREWSEAHGFTFTAEMIRNRDELDGAMVAEAARCACSSRTGVMPARC